MFRQDHYPERSTDKTMLQFEELHKKATVGKKALYLSLPFKGDNPADVIHHKLSGGVDETLHTAKLQILSTLKPLVQSCLIDSVLDSVTSFTCSYGAT